jgi:outer membrane protein assembly factor BamB
MQPSHVSVRWPVSRLARMAIAVSALAAGLAIVRADDEKPAQAQPAGEQPNPFLDRLFRNLFGGPAQQPLPPPRRRDPAGQPPAANTEDPEPGHLDVSLNSDSAATRDLQKLEPYIQRERWHEAVTGLQFLIERENDTFTPGRRGAWNSLRSRAEERLRSLSVDGRRAYFNLYDAASKDQLAQAQASGDVAALAHVARRFATIDAGAVANLELARLSFNRGEFVAAIRFVERLDSTQRAALLTSTDRLRYAYALRQSGRAADAEAIVAETPDTPADWWQSLAPAAVEPPPARGDWTMLFGAPSRTSVAVGSEPLLAERWSLAMTNLYSVAEQIDGLTTDLRDAGRACLPAVFPVAAEGCLAIRTLHGVQVIDVETGDVLWEEAVSDTAPERLLTTNGDPGAFEGRRRVVAGGIVYAPGGDGDQHPLTSLLYRDAVNGLLSTDGRQLFALADHAVLGRANVGYLMGNREEQLDPYGRDWKSNAIASYELRTGKLLWRVGGRRLGEVLDPPLAGTFFFGPPTPHDDRLYAVGERDSEISLFILDRRTGRPLATQPLANATAAIDVDMPRRLWPCQPAIAEGVIVCPTTAGWLVAVDAFDGRLLWAYSVQPTPRAQDRHRFAGTSMQQLQPLNTRWEPAPPVIAGRRVLFTPQEVPDATQYRQPALACLDLLTGRELWTRDKEPDDLALGGVFGDTVLVVGKSRLQWLSLEDGRAKWESTTFPLGSTPSGRGLAIGDSYYVPLTDGQVWIFQLSDGKVSARLQLPEGQRALGNLVMHRDTLTSVDPLQIRGFTQRSTVEAQITARRAADPTDFWALVREAEIHQLRGEHEQAVALLHQATAPADSDPGLVAEHLKLLEQSLWTLVEADLSGRDDEFRQLWELSDPNAPDIVRLAAERALARRDWPAAWEHLWALRADAAETDLLEDGPWSVRRDAWLGDKLATLYDAAPELRVEIDRAFESAVNDSEGNASKTASLQRVLSFHSQGRRLLRTTAERAEQSGELAAAALAWRQLAAADEPAEAFDAALRLVTVWARQGQAADANQVLLGVEAKLHAADAPDESALKRIAALRMQLALDSDAGTIPPLADWSGYDFEIIATRPGDMRQRVQELSPRPAVGAFYDCHVFEFVQNSQRLRIAALDGTDYWTLPLRSPSVQRNQYDPSLGVLTNGLTAYVVWQGTVSSLSLADRSVLWSRPLDVRAAGEEYRRNAYVNFDGTLQPAEQFALHWGLRRYQTPTGMLATASPECVIVHGRREITALDPATGEVLWARSGIPPQTMVHSDGGRIYVLPPDGTDPLVLDAASGAVRENGVLVKHASQAIAARNGRLVVVDAHGGGSILGLRKAKVRIRSLDSQSGAEAWSVETAAKTLIGRLPGESLLLLDPEGSLQTLDLSTGESRTLGAIPAELMPSLRLVQLVADRSFLYLLIDQQPSQNINYVSVPAARINGTVLCFDLRREGLVWQQAVASQNLLLPHFEQCPALVFLNQTHENGAGYFRTELRVLDKRTGRELASSRDLITQNQLHQYDVDLDVPRLRLHTYSARLEVRPARPQPAATPAEATQDAQTPAAPAEPKS